MIKIGVYKHYKGNHYQVIGIAKHTESEEIVVVYQALYGDYGLWVRPVTMFEECVEINNKKIPRFRLISESNTTTRFIRE